MKKNKKDYQSIAAKSERTDSGDLIWKVYLSNEDMQITPKKDARVKQGRMKHEPFLQMLESATIRSEAPVVCHVQPTPKGFVDGYVTNKEGTLGMVFAVPGKRSQFLLKEGGKEVGYCIPYPNCIYLLTVKDGNKRNFYCYTYEKWEGLDTKLYHYPFGNVSEDGRICMGTISSMRITDYQGAKEYIMESRLGVTNGDYLHASQTRTLTESKQSELCEIIKDKDKFPSGIMIPYSNLKGNHPATVNGLCQVLKNLMAM